MTTKPTLIQTGPHTWAVAYPPEAIRERIAPSRTSTVKNPAGARRKRKPFVHAGHRYESEQAMRQAQAHELKRRFYPQPGQAEHDYQSARFVARLLWAE